jgi:Dolichyl-phosphate-mannose-protein mannosyltransferase
MQPYIAFPLPHFPLLETLIALMYSVLPVGITVVEVMSQFVVLLSAILLYAIGARLYDSYAGMAAAGIYSLSYLIFRFHVFEREIYVSFVILILTLVILMRKSFGVRELLACSLLLLLALLMKLTAVGYLPAVCTYLLFMRTDRRIVLGLFIFTIVLFVSATAIGYVLYGRDFLIQVFLFRIAHGKLPWFGKLILLLRVLTVNIVLAIPGLFLIKFRTRQWTLVLLHLVFASFVIALNPTFWPHNGIELLPWLSLLGGVFISEIGKYAIRLVRRQEKLVTWKAIGLLLFLLGFGGLLQASFGDWGFGFRSREELQTMADRVRMRTPPDEPIMVPNMIALLAERIEFIRYPEVLGSIIEQTRSVNQRGFLNSLILLPRNRSFSQNVTASSRNWTPYVLQAIKSKKLKAFINSAPADKGVASLILPEKFLNANGYIIDFKTEHYTLWIPR